MQFKNQTIKFASGVIGQTLEIPSASPVNYHQVISTPEDMPRTTVDGKLFIRTDCERPLPLVMVCPGSLGIAESHLAHAETLFDLGFATFVLDSFGARNVTSTVANQTQFSFAASAYDVLAAFEVLSALDEIDSHRIGAQGHSRGGSAVLTAATRCFADAVVGAHRGLKAILPAYPWSGQQFVNPNVGDTLVRVLMGDRDDWCSPAQVQAHCQAIRLAGGEASMMLVGGAGHGFDRETPVEEIPEAVVALGTPTTYLADDGAMIHPLKDEPDPSLVDLDVMVYALKAGYGSYGAKVGSAPGEAELFREEMIRFWRKALDSGN